jgi:cysteine desulfurase
MSKIIYLDHASTTPVRKEVVKAMKPYWTEEFGNPSAITKMGVSAKKVLEASRKIVADSLERRPNEIFFTSGGTESNNLAILGREKFVGLHFITTNIEHSSVLACFKEIERRGGEVEYLKVNERGLVEVSDLRKLLKPNTVLVSIAYANNEIGTVQPIKDIAKEVRHANKNGAEVIFHTDASQAGMYLDLNINQLGVDLMTLDAQKMGGPKGVGVLFKKAEVNISPVLFGGGQEKGLRSGTENIPLIVGLAKAFELARKDFSKKALKVKEVRDYFWTKVQKEIPAVVLNGDLESRLPNNLNFSIPGIDPEFTVLRLDEKGIVCSTKSACSHDSDESYVIRALGKSDEIVKSALRFSLGENITKKEIDFVIRTLYNTSIYGHGKTN